MSEWTRSDFEQFLNELDRDLRIATAVLAGELGFAVCRCCWPPEVLATDLAGQVISTCDGRSTHSGGNTAEWCPLKF
jgi:hypothetical protein